MARWLEHDEEHAGPTGERGEPTEAFDETGGSLEPARQVDEQDVDGTRLEERAGHRESLIGVRRGEHDEPLEADATRHRLDRVQAAIEVEPGDDRAGRLRLGDEPEGDRRPPARSIAAQGEARRPRDAARSEQRIELRETGRDDGHAGCAGYAGYAGCARERSTERLARTCRRPGERLGRERLAQLGLGQPSHGQFSRGQPRLGQLGQHLGQLGQHLGRERHRRE